MLEMYLKGKMYLKNLVVEESGDSNFDDGGSIGWLQGKGLAVVIIAILLGLVTAFVPNFWGKVEGYIMGLF